MRGIPYGQTPAERLAFTLAHPARNYALKQALERGYTSAPLLSLEFTAYNPTTLRDVLHVLRDHGFLKADRLILDSQNRPRQLIYVPTPLLATALTDLHTLTTELKAQLEAPRETHQ